MTRFINNDIIDCQDAYSEQGVEPKKENIFRYKLSSVCFFFYLFSPSFDEQVCAASSLATIDEK